MQTQFVPQRVAPAEVRARAVVVAGDPGLIEDDAPGRSRDHDRSRERTAVPRPSNQDGGAARDQIRPGEVESQEADEPPAAPRSVRDARIARSLVAAPGRLRRARQDAVRPGAAVVRGHRHTDRDRSSLGGPSHLVGRHRGPAMRDDVRFDLASVLVAGVGERIVAHFLEHGTGPSRGRARELRREGDQSVQRSTAMRKHRHVEKRLLVGRILMHAPYAQHPRDVYARRA